jgi:glutamyl-Q tRNA(Asp) synthetase
MPVAPALAVRLRALAPGFTTRFAPAPTGYLHLGHAVNAVWVWGIARAFDGRVLLRVEDHDRGRCRPEYERALLEDLDWLGLVPDGAGTDVFRASAIAQRQSDNVARYAARLDELDRAGVVYACRCSRSEIARDVIQGEPREHGEVRYPGTCRDARLASDSTPARRVRTDAGPAELFDDLRLGQQRQDPWLQCGDVLVRDRDGNWTYQFAVVVDDLEHGVDLVIRGEDLLESTGRQIRLARLLGRESPPLFLHHPLVRHADGRKLSKSARDTGLRDLRDAGRSRDEVLGLAAHLGGLVDAPTPLDPGQLADLFR